MILRRSRFVHLLPVGDGRALAVHALSHLRLAVDENLAAMIEFFAKPRDVADDAAFAALIERGILTDKSPEAELAEAGEALSAHHGRDPAVLLEKFRREALEGGESYWAAGPGFSLDDIVAPKGRLDLLLFGDCDVHMEADFLRREAADRGLDLRIAATFPDDLALAGEHRCDAIIIGALRSRHLIAGEAGGAGAAITPFFAEARRMIAGLRALTPVPILIDNLPEPTVQPLGLAERGVAGHRNRFRFANLALAELAEAFANVHVVDVAAALGAAGAERLTDDGQTGFTHFGSPGWMLQRPEAEKAATHDIFPDLAPLAAALGGDPYGREAVIARAHVDALITVAGFDRKKCVIVDLDGVLWPGVLAETGRPFDWTPEVSGAFSYIGHYFGLHEALLSLKKRGVLLACVSKNDEATVRELWRYEDHYPRERLLTPDDFVTWRVDWNDKAANIGSIADELGFALGAFLFIDDHPAERARVRQALPEVEVWGEDVLGLRRRLLTDPRLQTLRITEESALRTEATKAQLGRERSRAESTDEAAFLASLNVEARVERMAPGASWARIEELFQRTTQFNTTGARFSTAELDALAGAPGGGVFALRVRDRFGDHGLAGAAVVRAGEIAGLAISCRVLGLRVEHRFLWAVMEALRGDAPDLRGRIIETPRNLRARNVYRDNGFTLGDDQVWRRAL